MYTQIQKYFNVDRDLKILLLYASTMTLNKTIKM